MENNPERTFKSSSNIGPGADKKHPILAPALMMGIVILIVVVKTGSGSASALLQSPEAEDTATPKVNTRSACVWYFAGRLAACLLSISINDTGSIVVE